MDTISTTTPSSSSDSKASTPPGRRSIAAMAVAAGILLSRISGLVRQRVFAHYLGNSDSAGAFVAALRIPNLLQNLFGEGVLSASFVPVYARLLAEGKKEEAGKVAGTILSLLTIVVAILVALGVTFSQEMISVLAPGFEGDVRDLTIRLVAIMFPGMGLLVVSAWCLGVLNSHRRFFLSYVAPVLWNIAMIAALLGFGGRLMSSRVGQMQLAVVVAWATVAGAGLQLMAQFPGAFRLNRGLHLSLALSSEPVRKVIRNFFPALLSRGVVQLSAYIDQVLASYLGAQAVAAMGYAQMLYTLPVSLFGMSISSAELTEMSSTVGTAEEIQSAVRERLVRGLRRISFFIVPSSVGFIVLGGVISATLFQTGKFVHSDSVFVWIILAGSTVGLLATTQSRLCVSALWALHDTRTPATFAIIRVTLTAALGYIATFPLREKFGWEPQYSAACLTASAGMAGWIEFLLIRRALTGRIAALHVGFRPLARYWIAALVSAAIAFGVEKALPGSHPLVFGISRPRSLWNGLSRNHAPARGAGSGRSLEHATSATAISEVIVENKLLSAPFRPARRFNGFFRAPETTNITPFGGS